MSSKKMKKKKTYKKGNNWSKERAKPSTTSSPLGSQPAIKKMEEEVVRRISLSGRNIAFPKSALVSPDVALRVAQLKSSAPLGSSSDTEEMQPCDLDETLRKAAMSSLVVLECLAEMENKLLKLQKELAATKAELKKSKETADQELAKAVQEVSAKHATGMQTAVTVAEKRAVDVYKVSVLRLMKESLDSASHHSPAS